MNYKETCIARLEQMIEKLYFDDDKKYCAKKIDALKAKFTPELANDTFLEIESAIREPMAFGSPAPWKTIFKDLTIMK